MMISRPVNSTQVSTTLSFTLSPTPRRLTAATAAMNRSPTTVMPMPPARPRPKASDMLAAKAREAVEAEVIPEHITAKATRKVTKWMPKALVRIQGGAGGARILGDQLEVAEGREQSDAEGHEERQPDGAANEVGHLGRSGRKCRCRGYRL